MQHRQPFLPVQGLCQRTHCLEVVKGVQGNAGEPRPGLLVFFASMVSTRNFVFTMPLLPCSSCPRSISV